MAVFVAYMVDDVAQYRAPHTLGPRDERAVQQTLDEVAHVIGRHHARRQYRIGTQLEKHWRVLCYQ